MTAPAALAGGDLVAVRWAACPEMALSPALIAGAGARRGRRHGQGAALLAWGLYEFIELQGEASNRDVAVGSTAYFLTLAMLVLLVGVGLWMRRRTALRGRGLHRTDRAGTDLGDAPERFWIGAGSSGQRRSPRG